MATPYTKYFVFRCKWVSLAWSVYKQISHQHEYPVGYLNVVWAAGQLFIVQDCPRMHCRTPSITASGHYMLIGPCIRHHSKTALKTLTLPSGWCTVLHAMRITCL